MTSPNVVDVTSNGASSNDPSNAPSRGLFGGMRLFGNSGPPAKSKAELLEEEKRRQEALIQEQLQALQMGTDLEAERRRQDELLQATLAEQKKRKEEEERQRQQQEQEARERKHQEELELQKKKQQELERQKEQQALLKRQKELEAQALKDSATVSINAGGAQAEQSSSVNKDETPEGASVMSALERRRKQRQSAANRSSIRGRRTRESIGAPTTSDAPENVIASSVDDAQQQVTIESVASALSPQAPPPVSAIISPQRATTSRRATSPSKASPVPGPKPTTPKISPKASPTTLNVSVTNGQSQINMPNATTSEPAIVTFSVDTSIQSKPAALSAHLETIDNQSKKDRKNRHGDEVSLGTMKLKSPTALAKSSLKQRLHLEESSTALKDERPWESSSAKELLKKQRAAKKIASSKLKLPESPKTMQDGAFLDDNNSVFDKSVFGLLAQGDDSANLKIEDVIDGTDHIDSAHQAMQLEEGGQHKDPEQTAQNDEADFEATWDTTETDQHFVAELKRLKAKQGSSQHQAHQPKKSSTETAREEVKRLKLFEKEERRGKKSKMSRSKPVFSKEFKQAMDAVFAPDQDDDEYTATFSTRLVEGLPRELKQGQDEATLDNTDASGSEDENNDDDESPTPEAERILIRLRQRSVPSDNQSTYSRQTTRTTRSTRTERSYSSRTSSRSHRRAPNRSDSSASTRHRDRDQSTDRSTRSGISSRSGNRSKSRSKSAPREEHSTTGTSPRRRAFKGTGHRRTTSADASQMSQVFKTGSVSRGRSSSTGRSRTNNPTDIRAKRADYFGSGDSTAGSRTVRSVRSARTWNAQSTTDPAEFYRREMDRLRNKTVSTSGLQKEMSELRQQRTNQSPVRPKVPKAPKERHNTESLSVPTGNSSFQADLFGTSQPTVEDQAPHNVLSPFRDTEEAESSTNANFYSDGFGFTDQEEAGIKDASSKRFPRIRRALFRRPPSSKMEENEERLL